MKTLLILAAVLLAATFHANADSKVFPNEFWKPITPRTLKAAEACHAGGETVALVCKDCKTVNKATKKTLASFFKDNSTHDCSGCKGVIHMKFIKGGREQAPEVSHECSKCAKDSATCASHAK